MVYKYFLLAESEKWIFRYQDLITENKSIWRNKCTSSDKGENTGIDFLITHKTGN